MSNSSLGITLRKILGGRNLYLVGMMGSGKSSTGPQLAKTLSYGFVDSDSVIEGIIKTSISNFFESEGESSFREIESKVLAAIGERHSLIVATGGGIVLRKENWGVLHQGIVIWLDPSEEVLSKRLSMDKLRPLLKNKNESTINTILNERTPFYREADLHVSINDEPIEIVTQKVLEGLSEIISDPDD